MIGTSSFSSYGKTTAPTLPADEANAHVQSNGFLSAFIKLSINYAKKINCEVWYYR